MECKLSPLPNKKRIGDLTPPRIVRFSGGFWLFPCHTGQEGCDAGEGRVFVVGIGSGELCGEDSDTLVEDYGHNDDFVIKRMETDDGV